MFSNVLLYLLYILSHYFISFLLPLLNWHSSLLISSYFNVGVVSCRRLSITVFLPVWVNVCRALFSSMVTRCGNLFQFRAIQVYLCSISCDVDHLSALTHKQYQWLGKNSLLPGGSPGSFEGPSYWQTARGRGGLGDGQKTLVFHWCSLLQQCRRSNQVFDSGFQSQPIRPTVFFWVFFPMFCLFSSQEVQRQKSGWLNDDWHFNYLNMKDSKNHLLHALLGARGALSP